MSEATNKICPVHSAGSYKGLDSRGYEIYQCWCGRLMYNDPTSLYEAGYLKLKAKVGWREALKAFPDIKG